MGLGLKLGLIVVAVLAAAFAWHSFGWKPFRFDLGDTASWSSNGSGVNRLRFSNCRFAVVRPDGVSASADVTGNLNDMARAFIGEPANKYSPILSLDAPLNAFSFVIPGFNDAASAGDPRGPKWCSSAPAGAKVCPGSVVTLMGSYRVL